MKRFLGIVRVSLAAAVALWGRESFADDGICDEASAATIDGIPAYAMCTVASTSDVWSNDGVHTASSPGTGSGWVQTAYGNGYQCTELAGRYMQFVWSVTPDWLNGDAKDICSLPLPSSLEITMTPVHGDLAVFPGGCDGASTTTGHVAVVNTVSASKISVVQQNVARHRERRDELHRMLRARDRQHRHCRRCRRSRCRARRVSVARARRFDGERRFDDGRGHHRERRFGSE
jgi:surface antigen